MIAVSATALDSAYGFFLHCWPLNYLGKDKVQLQTSGCMSYAVRECTLYLLVEYLKASLLKHNNCTSGLNDS